MQRLPFPQLGLFMIWITLSIVNFIIFCWRGWVEDGDEGMAFFFVIWFPATILLFFKAAYAIDALRGIAH